jgi:hypothetical protein
MEYDELPDDPATLKVLLADTDRRLQNALSMVQTQRGITANAMSAADSLRAELATTKKMYGDICYAMLCYASDGCAMLCYSVLCYAVLCCAMLCYAMLCYAMLCYAMLCYASDGCAMLCCAVLCCCYVYDSACFTLFLL